MAYEEARSLDVDGVPVHYVAGIVDSATNGILFAHGGPGGNKDGPNGLLLHLAENLRRRGFSTFRVDFVGSSHLPGDYSDVTLNQQTRELAAVARSMQGEGLSVAVVGESLGGTVTLNGYDPRWRAVVLLFPAIELRTTSFSEFLTEPRHIQDRQSQGYVSVGDYRLSDAFLSEVETLDLWPAVGRVQSPTLLLHGTNDADVPYEQSQRAFDAMHCERSLELVGDGNHGLREPFHQARAVASAEAWILQALA